MNINITNENIESSKQQLLSEKILKIYLFKIDHDTYYQCSKIVAVFHFYDYLKLL